MKTKILTIFTVHFLLSLATVAQAQMQFQDGSVLLPANPTSADNLKLSVPDRTCGSLLYYVGNPYRVSLAQGNIIVNLGVHFPSPHTLCRVGPREEIDLGRLPAGNYTLSLIDTDGLSSAGPVFSNIPFTVTDARTLKQAPFVRLDYSGHWWDPLDPGWGLFIWHDARDNVLAAWFTYGLDGKPTWYTFQPIWETNTATKAANMYQTSRMPGPTVPPPNPTSLTLAGTASLDFTNFALGDEGKFTYLLGSGLPTIRNIQRFKP